MTTHRASYWKVAIFASTVLIGHCAAIGWLLRVTFGTPEFSLSVKLLSSIGSLFLFSTGAATALVLTGALVVLRRDNLERLGRPYAGSPREWHGGFVTQALRSCVRALRSTAGAPLERLDLHAGELVEIRPWEEILATLDSRGELDSLPFMPEMQSLCGRKARVHRRVDKIFDWITMSGLRRMRNTVILDGLRCDGGYHETCQADCPILWKEAWLRRASAKLDVVRSTGSSATPPLDLRQFTTRIDADTSETRFVCQLSRLPQATTPTPWNSPRNLLRELSSGNVRFGPFLTFISIFAFNAVQKRSGGACFPILGHSQSARTPHEVLNIQPGELVRIRTKREIEETLNAQFKNRGLWFDKEMTRFCGGIYKVRARVDRQIDERTGKMVIINTPCITLEGVTATGEYFEFAPLDERIYWREIWLERIEGENEAGQEHSEAS
ncbi:MAG: hypothetical protein JST28_23325 [Acidobacteria bacterium]|nr:hypothetical protein [Acidobacteriota bacterium]